MSLNKQTCIGRLTKDPELKKITVRGEEVSVCNFTIACDEDRGEGTDFINVVTWRATADNVAKYLAKGRLVYVEGRPKTRSYPVTKDGVEFQNYITEIQNATVQFLDRGNNAADGGNTAEQNEQAAPQTGSVPF